MELKRLSGILAHPTMFPSPYGIGDLGSGAYSFLDFLYKGKQKLWQILPLNPTGLGDSPYQSFSVFAGNDLIISPQKLIESGLLEKKDCLPMPVWDDKKVDYGPVITYKEGLLRKAYGRFTKDLGLKKGYHDFCETNKGWLDDYALFVSIKRSFINYRRALAPEESEEYKEYRGKYLDFLGKESVVMDYFYGAVWNSWPRDIALREAVTLARWRWTLDEEIGYEKFKQYVFYEQWDELIEYARERGISVIGDLPIFAAYDNADVWVNKELFQLRGFDPAYAAGVPPDYFSVKGQLWGNPLYDWEEHKRTGFAWWLARLRHALGLADTVRIDHFRGFEAYWSIPFGAKDAVGGKWVKGPGAALFEAICKELGDAPIIAEDLGFITEEVRGLRRRFGLPGMKVLQFAFLGGADSPDMPHNLDGDDFVVYTGTHDNDTTVGWYKTAPESVKDYLRRYLNTDGKSPSWDLTRAAFMCAAKYAVIPIQDIFELGTEARTNEPGTLGGNWQFRFTEEMLKDGYAEGLKYLSELFGRNLDEPETEDGENGSRVMAEDKTGGVNGITSTP